MKVIYLRDALKDMQWVRHYYRNVFPAGQVNARESLKTAERVISQHPFIGHPCDDIENVREYRISRTPFSLLYQVIGDRIEVLRVIDNRSDWLTKTPNL